MAFATLRDFLSELERQGQLLRIQEETPLEPDLGAAGRAISNLVKDTAPALLFEKLQGYTDARIALNVHGSWSNHAIMMGMPKDTPVKEQFYEFVRRYQSFPGEVVERANAPWQEVVVEGAENINLFEVLPLFRLNRNDGGFYLDKTCVVSRDPDDPENVDKQNVGIYRLQVKGRNRIGIQPVPEHDIAIHFTHAEERGEDLKVAIAISNEPIISVVAGMPILPAQSEYKMAAVLQGEPYPIVHSSYSNLDLPWGSEVVLEGVMRAGVREMEGPFGEFTGHYSGARRMPVIEITRMSYRRNPLFEPLYLGMPWTEIDYYMGINTSAPLYVQLKESFPEVVAVNAMYTHGLVVIISTKSRFGGFAKSVGMRAMTTPHGLGYAKVVIMVDETIDPFDLNQVMWAISTKMHPKYDLVTIPNLSVLPLDPGSEPIGITDKLIIDATTPIAPETRGHYDQPLDTPLHTEIWENKLKELLHGK
ncbi:non-oxidative hydroxyarylic acid decarboxylases subunit C [Telmatobacter bradus]|uniref:non-oxidative hydroxyarylic acid decarboxylases subunit C n=1 Tax=Telmatobacter bradus TaxID=474953 RepID=UPI003B4378EE